jgi:hypothetical protein
MKTVGRFGQSGDGNRTGRRTMTRGGMGPTWRASSSSGGRQARLDDPSVAEIWEAVRTQQCCWCDDPRTFRSLSGHLERGHGFNLNELRDLLLVPKNTPFAGEAYREKCRVRLIRQIEDGVTVRPASPKGARHVLGAYGKANQKEMSARSHAKHPPRQQICEECGATFAHKQSRKSCGKPACKFAVKSRALLGKAKSITKPRTVFRPRTMHPCSVCGTAVYQRKTCSRECFVLGQRATAQSREHLLRMCDVDGCQNAHKAKGLCANHYQNQRRAT